MNFTKTALAMGSAISVGELMKTIQGVHLQDVLGPFGLERKPSTLAHMLPAVALIAVSAVVGAGIALLVAPTSGTKLRARLSDGIDGVKHRLTDSAGLGHNPADRHSIS